MCVYNMRMYGVNPYLQVCLVTLQLFDVLTTLPQPEVMQTLVLQYWRGCIRPPSPLDTQGLRKELEQTIER